MTYLFSAFELVFIHEELHRLSYDIINKEVMELNTIKKINYTFTLNKISNLGTKIEKTSSDIFNPMDVSVEITEEEKEILLYMCDYSEDWYKSVTAKNKDDDNCSVLSHAQEIFCRVLKEKINKGY